jgi:predicted transglutaminase-like cysteine proteinase
MNYKKLLITLAISFSVGCSYAKTQENKISLVKVLQSTNDDWNKNIKLTEGLGKNWQTPEETYSNKKGHIEDLVIVKYFDLIAKGIPKENLKIVISDIVVNGKKKKHMFLVCFDKNHNYVLDVINSKVLDIKNREDIKNIKLVMNHKGVFMKNSLAIDESVEWTSIRNQFNKHVIFLNQLNKKQKEKSVQS